MNKLRITEIFYSLQGETQTVGLPTIFIRLTGCPLRCHYCDTSYAFKGGEWMTFDAILQAIAAYRTPYVTVTGGEPLAQPHCPALLTLLCDKGYQVSLETSGAISTAGIDPRVRKILDIKTPASGEVDNNLWANITTLQDHDEVKFVICDRADYEWAKAIIVQDRLKDRPGILFSPSYTELSARTLADWILADQLPVRLQVQLHKVLWDDEPGR